MGTHVINIKDVGNFDDTEKYLKRVSNMEESGALDIIAQDTVDELKKASPRRDSSYGDTHIADSWNYEIVREGKRITLYFNNSEIQNGINIALIVNDGHLSKNGNWVPGQNYIDEPIQKACDRILEHLKEDL